MGDELPVVALGQSRTAKSLALSSAHTCVLLNDGNVKCWGANNHGEIGITATQTYALTPQAVVTIAAGRQAKSLTSGAAHTCALLDDASVTCWGNSEDIGLGGASNPPSQGKVDLGSNRTAKSVASRAGRFTCALLDNGKIKCWGRNANGELGIGNNVNRGDYPMLGHEMGDLLPAIEL
jgi:alpha-tubulin suppressor-like RCC1 family protein